MKREDLNIGKFPGYLWTPPVNPAAVILILHGMTEHAGRYEELADFLTSHHYAMAAYDLPGHGRNSTPSDCAAMAPGDWNAAIDGIDSALSQLRGRFSCPVFLLGFSLGSFLAREYLQRPQPKMDGLILVGTGWQPKWLLKIMKVIVRTQIKKVGFDHNSPLVQKLSFGAYNEKFKPNRTKSDWLCSDETALDRYLSDPLCRSETASGTFYELLCSMERTRTARPNVPLPVLLLSGDQDPVGNFGKSIAVVQKSLKAAGYPVEIQIFPGARHMLLNEESGGQAEKARQYLLNWLHRHI